MRTVADLSSRVLGHVLDLALPATCAGCGREGDALCRACLPAVRTRIDAPAGTPIGLVADTPDQLLQLEWCAPFSGTVRRTLHALKYAGELRAVEPLGRALADRWRVAGAGGDLVVHVPVHRDRRRARGYDQAERIAAVAAAHLRLPHLTALERRRATGAQFQLDRSHRARNVAGAFGLAAGVRPGQIRGRWAILVDDVVTTGSTLSACAEVLLAAGAMGVSAITVARER